MNIVKRIAQKSGGRFRAASPSGIDRLRSLGMPEEALVFYAVSEPVRTIEIERVRLSPIAAILEENTDYVPRAYAHPCGYVVFATTDCGDAFCFDTRSSSGTSSPIVLITHDLEPENDEMKREDLEKLAKPVAPDLQSFLEAFVSGALDREPLYPPFNWNKS